MGINIAPLGVCTKTWDSYSSGGWSMGGVDAAFQVYYYDGNRTTYGTAGGSFGSRSGTVYVTAKLTMPSMRIDRIYVKGAGAAEEGGHGNCESISMDVYVNEASVYSTGITQSVPTEWDDSTVRTGVTSVWFKITASYSRPGDENNSGFAYVMPYEFEVYGDPGGYGVML